MLTEESMRASITFAAGQSSEIGRYEVLREESLPGLGIGMTIDDFQIVGIRHDVMEPLKSVVRYSVALGYKHATSYIINYAQLYKSSHAVFYDHV